MSMSPLSQKLRVKDGYRIALVNPAPGSREALEPLPDSVSISDTLNDKFDLVWHFASWRSELQRDLEKVRESVKPQGLIWLSYPKGTSGVPTDLKREVMVEVAETAGLQPVAQIAVDNVWSAMRFKPVE